SLERNGATHKFLKRQLIFEDRRGGVMSEVLHFTDYPFRPAGFQQWFPHTRGGEVKTLDYWVRYSFEKLDKTHDRYKPLFFLDSGGFRLLFNRDVDISAFGYEPRPESILQLQLDYGADIVASLDYPIPPFLNQEQALDRIKRSIGNAITLMRLLYRENKRDLNNKRPFPILAVHGQTPSQMQTCVSQLLQQLDKEGLNNEPFGIGIGSLVPLRIASSVDKVIMIVKTAIDTLRDPKFSSRFNTEKIPIHVFGITGNMIPVLTHLGVDTFDSSSYIKSASSLDYYDPKTWSPRDFHSLESLSCDCNACDGITPEQLAQMQEDLRGKKINGNQERLGHKAGKFVVDIKSDVYGIMAYHNLNLQDEEIARARKAIDEERMTQHLVQFGKTHPRSQGLIEFMTEVDPAVAGAFGHVQIKLFPQTREEFDQQHEVSLANDPHAFDLRTYSDYTKPPEKDRLLLLACSQGKPYRSSKSHSTVFRFLRQHVNDALDSCHKVTISGLYGPVPLEFEDVDAVRTYEYILSTSAKRQRELVIERLVAYLEAHLNEYQRIVAHVAAGAYRSVVEAAFKQITENFALTYGDKVPFPVPLILTPEKTKGTGTKDLLSHVNLTDLVHALYPEKEGLTDVPIQLSSLELL
ncbi:MAG TPA: DUF5591 domain-containing protein, partial [Ktedonobacteraceae bacterium]|nr:DUF5591 domain-containing protein [Ktedonobacteraceae bacterium]